MKRFIPTFIFTALVLTLLASACSGLPAPTITSAEATALVSGLTMLPQGTGAVITTVPQTGVAPLTGTGTPQAALPALTQPASTFPAQQQVPVTGNMQDTRILCIFCVDGLSHSMVLLPAGATYELVPPANGQPINTTCTVVEQINNRQMLLCYGGGNYTFSMKVCIGDSCSEFPVELKACPKPKEVQQAPGSGGILPTSTPGTGPTLPPPTQPTTEPPTPTTEPPTVAPTSATP